MEAIDAIPTAATLLEQVDPHPRDDVAADVRGLRSAIGALDLSRADVVVLVVRGPTRVAVSPRVDLAGYGYPDVRAAIGEARPQADHLAQHLGVEVDVADVLDGEVGVLALQAARHGPVDVVAVSLDDDLAAVDVLTGVLRGLADATRLAIVVAGDLSATLTDRSPGYLVEGAQDWDRRALGAIESLDVDTLRGLGPDAARDVMARGWAPLLVAVQMAHELGLGRPDVRYAAPHGVGHVVARFA